MHSAAYLALAGAALLCACSAPAPAPEAEQPPPPPQDTVVRGGSEAPDLLLPARMRAVWQLTPEDRWDNYWVGQYTDSTGGLGHRSADFDGDGTVDHAVLLTRKDTARRDSSYALFVQLNLSHDTVLTVEPWAEYDGHIGLGLRVEPPGPMGHLGGEEGGEPEGTVDLKQPAITLEYFEKASITWFWKDGSFHKVWTGD